MERQRFGINFPASNLPLARAKKMEAESSNFKFQKPNRHERIRKPLTLLLIVLSLCSLSHPQGMSLPKGVFLLLAEFLFGILKH